MKITKTETAVTPSYADNGSAGMDLYVDTEKEYIRARRNIFASHWHQSRDS